MEEQKKKDDEVFELYKLGQKVLVLESNLCDVHLIDKNSPDYKIKKFDKTTMKIKNKNYFYDSLDLELFDWMDAVDDIEIRQTILRRVGLL